MDSLIAQLLSRLSHRGVVPCEFPNLITDLFNILGEGGNFTLACVNQRLEDRGWEHHVMDDHTFELLLEFLMGRSDLYEVTKHTLH